MAIGKILKIGGAALAATGTVAGAAEVIKETVVHNETQVVEQYNYEQIHEINIIDTYFINGVEVDESTYTASLDSLQSIATDVHSDEVNVLAEGSATIYYGALDKVPTNLSSLTSVKFDFMPTTFTKHITSGHGEGRYAVGQYVVLAIPETYQITYWYTTDSLFGLTFDKINIGSYDVYYLTEAVDDSDLGGTTYIWEFAK